MEPHCVWSQIKLSKIPSAPIAPENTPKSNGYSMAARMQTGPMPMLAPWIKPAWLAKIELAAPPPGLDGLCWLWWGSRTIDGYPRAWIKGKAIYLHRHSWEQANGKPLGYLDGHHRCSRRNCFQDRHIEPQTPDDNRGATRYVPMQHDNRIDLCSDDLRALADSHWLHYNKSPGYAIGRRAS